jgi:hypothetical protein
MKFVLKTMWNMPAELVRTSTADEETGQAGERIASGSLEQMIEAFDEHEGGELEGVIIKCAGRDRPITSQEIRDLRRHRITAKAA